MSLDGRRAKRHRNIADNFNHPSRVHERYRETTDVRTTTYSERERVFTFAKIIVGYKNMTVLLGLYLKLDSQALTLCVQTPVIIFALDGHTVTTPYSHYVACMFVFLTVYREFLGIFRDWFHIRISTVIILCLSFLLFGLCA